LNGSKPCDPDIFFLFFLEQGYGARVFGQHENVRRDEIIRVKNPNVQQKITNFLLDSNAIPVAQHHWNFYSFPFT
jgi:hypothetical protein